MVLKSCGFYPIKQQKSSMMLLMRQNTGYLLLPSGLVATGGLNSTAPSPSPSNSYLQWNNVFLSILDFTHTLILIISQTTKKKGRSFHLILYLISLSIKWKELGEWGMHPSRKKVRAMWMLKPKDCMSDTPLISFVTLNKFLYIPKSRLPHL